MILEMFFWTKPLGLRVFRMTAEQAQSSATLAANQGLYNGFLAAGLLWGAWQGSAGTDVQLFFLACVVIAGVYAGIGVARKILYAQALPGVIAFALVLLAR